MVGLPLNVSARRHTNAQQSVGLAGHPVYIYNRHFVEQKMRRPLKNPASTGMRLLGSIEIKTVECLPTATLKDITMKSGKIISSVGRRQEKNKRINP